jgi:hypothetical protein
MGGEIKIVNKNNQRKACAVNIYLIKTGYILRKHPAQQLSKHYFVRAQSGKLFLP